jgi:hypothetical protein
MTYRDLKRELAKLHSHQLDLSVTVFAADGELYGVAKFDASNDSDVIDQDTPVITLESNQS